MTDCQECNGSGQKSTPCGTCGGDGRVRKSKKINLRVPPGVDDGSRLRVRGEGNSGRKGGESGDLYVFLSVKSDKGAPPVSDQCVATCCGGRAVKAHMESWQAATSSCR